MFSLIFSCLLQSVPALFNGDAPSPALCSALTVAQEIRPAGATLDTKQKINQYFQACWLRSPGSERNELGMSETVTPEQTGRFNTAFSRLGMIGNQEPTVADHPAVIVILGGAYPSMKERVAFAKRFMQSLKKTPTVILLTGDRDLEKTRADDTKPLDDGVPADSTTEEDVGKYLVDNNRDFSMILLNSPKQPDAKRATTADTAKTLQNWLIANKTKGTVMLISTEPHGPYQLLSVQKNCRVEDVLFDVRAVPLSGSFDAKMIAICMDALARMVFTVAT